MRETRPPAEFFWKMGFLRNLVGNYIPRLEKRYPRQTKKHREKLQAVYHEFKTLPGQQIGYWELRYVSTSCSFFPTCLRLQHAMKGKVLGYKMRH